MKAIIKFIKKLAIYTSIVGIVGITAYVAYYVTRPSTVTTAPAVEEVVVEEVHRDALDIAREELQRATAALDAEEEKLLAEIAEREARIEQINEIRSSF